MEYAQKPPALSSEGSMSENWVDWKQQFLIFLKASGIADKPTDVKASILLNLIGPVGMKVFKKFIFHHPADKENVDILMEKFDDHFSPRKTEVHDRYIFFSSTRQKSETIRQYVETLKEKANCCNFGVLTETLIRDKLVLDMKNKDLRKHLFEQKYLSLSQVIDLWEKCEHTELISKLCISKELLEKQSYKAADKNLSKKTWNCIKCNTSHEPKQCPAQGKKCENCGMYNHLTACCNKPAALKNNLAQNDLV
ncbi:uncharacterized protein LOC124404666 [Diprion similis]|uniref:uncharacterized protein LOC124404666 n=1 Tax=Diprion similis TaxID=362088 RepID=UPI001EF7B494|nr:uncharacterized protein LOC124404666 [Diprion similis]